jgi:hypothetical protein
VAPRRDSPPGEKPRAHLTVAALIVVIALVGLAVGTMDLTRRHAAGSPDDYQWVPARAAVRDDFRRPNQVGLGTARTGQAWDQLSGAWSITGQHAVGQGPGFAVVPVTASHLRTTGGGLAFRCPNTRNCWWISPSPSVPTWNVQRTLDGRTVFAGNLGYVPAGPHDTLAVHLDGDRIEVSVDGLVRRVFLSPTLEGAKGVGLAGGVGPETWRSFEADR